MDKWETLVAQLTCFSEKSQFKGKAEEKVEVTLRCWRHSQVGKCVTGCLSLVDQLCIFHSLYHCSLLLCKVSSEGEEWGLRYKMKRTRARFSVEERCKEEERAVASSAEKEEEEEDANKGIHNGRVLKSEITLSEKKEKSGGRENSSIEASKRETVARGSV